MLYRQNNKKFEEKYLRKLERNWQKNGSQFFQRRNLKEKVMSELKIIFDFYFYFILFSILESKIRVSITLYVTVTYQSLSHNHILYRNIVEGFRKKILLQHV